MQDPREAKRDEARGWMNDNKDKLEQQVTRASLLPGMRLACG